MRISNKGFSLVELLVVLSIFVILTSLILARQNKYSSDSQITNLSYKMALALREAQVYGLSVKANGSGAASQSGNEFDVGYAMHFDSTTKTSFFMFVDKDKNHILNDIGVDDPTNETALTTYTLDKGITIGDICVDNGSQTTQTCASSGAINKIDIGFVRPNPKAFITAYQTTANGNIPPNSRALITIVSPLKDKKTKCIVVTASGQISVIQPTNTGTQANPVYVCQ